MTGQIPSSTQWERPYDRPAPDPVSDLEASIAGWCADNGHVHEVIVDRAGRGVAVTIAELFNLDIVRVFRGDTRTEALRLASTWILDRGTA